MLIKIYLIFRDQIMGMKNENREEIIKTLSNMPAALSVDDVSDFCSLARYYVLKTPSTFKEVRFLCS